MKCVICEKELIPHDKNVKEKHDIGNSEQFWILKGGDRCICKHHPGCEILEKESE